MSFNVVCLIGLFVATPFGLAFLFAPEIASSIYGISGWNSGTTAIARLFGIELLYMSGAIYAVRQTPDSATQRRFSQIFALASTIACVVLIQAVLAGSANSFLWSSVAIYAFFALAWANLGFRSTSAN